MRAGRGLLLAAAALAVLTAVVGCGRSSLRVGWVGSDGLRRKTASYRTFTGTERASFRAERGQMIELDYDVEVEEGTLMIRLLDPDGERVVDRTFRDDAADATTLTAPQSGRYRLQIEGRSTRGAFDVSWSVGGGPS